MGELGRDFVDFLIEAKRNTYAVGDAPTGSCRKGSKDLGYAKGEYEYLDSYFGGIDFLGGEVVYSKGRPVWGMNYYGRSVIGVNADGGIDADFGEILHAALMQPPREAPYRGPRSFKKGDCEYRCSWEGALEDFRGDEEIMYKGARIYFLRFHGGSIA